MSCVHVLNCSLQSAPVEEENKEEDEGQMIDPKFEEFERMRRAEAAKKMHQDQEHTVPKHDFNNKNTGGQRNYNQPRQHNHMTYRGNGTE